MSDSRLEKFIYAICSMDVTDLPVPLSRIETLWNCLITGETPDFEPLSRNEKYLMAMLDRYDISNLPAPMSRGEKLLYKIAVGETDLSDIPGYYSRYEELLKYLIENGGISGGDFEYVLYTLNQSLYTLYTTAEKPVKSAILRGNTIKRYKNNLFDGLIENGGLSINTGENDDRYPTRGRSINFIKVEPNSTITFARNLGANGFHVVGYNKNKEFVKGFTDVMKANVLIGKINTTSDIYYIKFYDIAPTSESEFGVFQGDVEPTYELTSVKLPVLTTTGKNLINSFKNNTGINTTNGNETTISEWITSDFIKVKSGVTYTLTIEGDTPQTNGGYTYLYLYSIDDKSYLGVASRLDLAYRRKFSFTSDYYIKITTKMISVTKFQVEEGSVATAYEPFKSNILSTSEDVVLRGIGDVQDTLDCLTGEVVERIGEIVLDGSEQWRLVRTGESTFLFGCDDHIIGTSTASSQSHICNTFKVCAPDANGGIWDRDEESIAFKDYDTNKIRIRILKSKVSDLISFKSWLSSNPVKVQYKLTEKVHKTVDLTVVDQDNQPTQLGTFKNITHVTLESAGLIPEVEMEVATNLLEDTVFTLTDAFNTLYPTAEKPVVDGTLYGQTLVNLLDAEILKGNKGKINVLFNVTLEDDYFVSNHGNGQFQLVDDDGKSPFEEVFEEGKTYTLIIDVTTTDKTGNGDEIYLELNTTTHTTPNLTFNNANGIIKRAFKATKRATPETKSVFKIGFYDRAITKINRKIMLLEGDYTNVNIPYFEGVASVKAPVLTTTGKNLFKSLEWELGFINSATGAESNHDKYIRTKNYIDIQPNMTYTATGYMEYFMFYDSDKNFISGVKGSTVKKSVTFTTPSNARYLKLRYFLSSIPTLEAMMNTENMIEKGSTATPYEPYKSTTLLTPSDLELRKVGEVKDEVNVMTGEVVERVGEIVLANREWIKPEANFNAPVYGTKINNLYFANDVISICDKLSRIPYENRFNINIGQYYTTAEYIFIGYNDVSVSEFKSYIDNLSPKLQYQFKTPNTKTVDISIVDQNGQQTKLRTFDDTTHVLLESEAGPNPSASLTVRTKIPSASSTSLLMDDISNEQQQLETTVDEQSNNVDATMIATTEIYEETL